MKMISRLLAMMDRHMEHMYADCGHQVQQKARSSAWISLFSFPLTLAAPLVGILQEPRHAAYLIITNAPLLALELFAFFLIFKGHFKQIQEGLFWGYAILHISAGLYAGLHFSIERFFCDFALYGDAIILATGVLSSRRTLLGVSAVEILSIVLMRLLLPEPHGSPFEAYFSANFMNNVTSMGLVAAMTWILMAMTNRSLQRVQSELEANRTLQEGLEAKVIERTTELESARIAAESANRIKSQFLANMSHEVRTPLHGILGMTDLILEDAVPKIQQERLRFVVESGNHLMGVISDILDYTQIQDHAIALQQETVNLRAFLDGILGSTRPLAAAKDLELALWTAPDLPELIQADALRLRQMLMNILGNAIKFTHRGEVRLAVETADGILSFAIQDTGIGIPSSSLKLIFEQFSQADASDTRRFGGTGLGLSISKALAEAMGGSLEAFSTEGVGTTFTAKIPLLPAPDQSSANESSADGIDSRSLKGTRILLVDDNVTNRKVAEGILVRKGCTVGPAEHGRMALAMLGRHPYDLVLMDCQMPVMDGFEATRILRGWRDHLSETHRNAARIPVIALTANATEQARNECLGAGMDEVLVKPYRAGDLIAATLRWLPPGGSSA